MKTHLAFVKADIRRQLEAGTKTCETRLSKRSHPARHTQAGDQLLFKESGGEVFMIATIAAVHVYSNLYPTDVMALAQQFETCKGTGIYWEAKWNCPHAVILMLTDLRATTLPVEQTPRGVMLGWVQDFINTAPQQPACSSYEPLKTRRASSFGSGAPTYSKLAVKRFVANVRPIASALYFPPAECR